MTSRRPFWCTEQKRKKSFGNLILLLCKTWTTFCHCFVLYTNGGRLITWVKTKNTFQPSSNLKITIIITLSLSQWFGCAHLLYLPKSQQIKLNFSFWWEVRTGIPRGSVEYPWGNPVPKEKRHGAEKRTSKLHQHLWSRTKWKPCHNGRRRAPSPKPLAMNSPALRLSVPPALNKTLIHSILLESAATCRAVLPSWSVALTSLLGGKQKCVTKSTG